MTLGSSTNTHSDGIFGWYRYIQDFTGDFALHWIDRLSREGDVLWDPFAGSGTSMVAAKMLGIPSAGFDMNPFMVDVARVKLNWSIDPGGLEAGLDDVLGELSEERLTEPVEVDRIRWAEYDDLLDRHPGHAPIDEKLSKWISPAVLDRCRALLAAIDNRPEPSRSFLRLAAASILIPASNMKFRPNICYEGKAIADYPVVGEFENRATEMIKDYREVFSSSETLATAHVGDARTDHPDRASLIFTSPPYPNDMEYVHQTRLELSLLGYVDEQKELTALKKQMMASSVKLVYRSNEWQKQRGVEVPGVAAVVDQLAETLKGKNWGWNAADMTAQFFGGMRSVLNNWHEYLEPGGLAAVVIGDSAFNGVKIETDRLLAECAEMHGFRTEGIVVFRRRVNSKHNIELRESVVVLRRA